MSWLVRIKTVGLSDVVSRRSTCRTQVRVGKISMATYPKSLRCALLICRQIIGVQSECSAPQLIVFDIHLDGLGEKMQKKKKCETYQSRRRNLSVYKLNYTLHFSIMQCSAVVVIPTLSIRCVVCSKQIEQPVCDRALSLQLGINQTKRH